MPPLFTDVARFAPIPPESLASRLSAKPVSELEVMTGNDIRAGADLKFPVPYKAHKFVDADSLHFHRDDATISLSRGRFNPEYDFVLDPKIEAALNGTDPQDVMSVRARPATPHAMKLLLEVLYNFAGHHHPAVAVLDHEVYQIASQTRPIASLDLSALGGASPPRTLHSPIGPASPIQRGEKRRRFPTDE